MARNRDLVPRRDQKFDEFIRVVVHYTAGKTGGDHPAWTHIPPAAFQSLEDALDRWIAAWEAAWRPHTPAETVAKKEARAAAEGELRRFINAWLRCHPAVTDEDRFAMGIPVRRGRGAPVPAPEAQPDATVVYPGVHLIKLVNIHPVGKGAEQHRRNCAVRIYWGILGPPGKGPLRRLDAPPETGDDLPHSVSTHRKRYGFDFSGESGRQVWFCLRYENEKGGKEGEGPFGPLFSAIIP
jgi:hypothetical protein